ncbi:hypothetical protein CYLTODRAFT_441366 [Cylindrobasidium torrendii FP15055 ss-10]|uniref:Uncharacterized protein n=1 Tax=Cylindrobasidium torrendii FP15055 ss-10 TaxID=1314674 RepID=A0A0D7BM49_9AGAR|nr:hypothetical protein CYLTODRAFT_441366 [Cylindrobasidium torrendii FP15055 ss-10]
MNPVRLVDIMSTEEEYQFVPRAKELNKLEFYWGLEPNAMSSDGEFAFTERGKVQLSPDVVACLRDGDHALLPSMDALRSMIDIHEWNCEHPTTRRTISFSIPNHQYTLISTCSTESGNSANITLPIHPAYVLGASYQLFTNVDLSSASAEMAERLDLVRELAEFYLLQLPVAVRHAPEWQSRGMSPSRVSPRRRPRCYTLSMPAEDILPLMIGAPDYLPTSPVDIDAYLSSSESDVSSLFEPLDECTDSESDSYSQEPCRPIEEVMASVPKYCVLPQDDDSDGDNEPTTKVVPRPRNVEYKPKGLSSASPTKAKPSPARKARLVLPPPSKTPIRQRAPPPSPTLARSIKPIGVPKPPMTPPTHRRSSSAPTFTLATKLTPTRKAETRAKPPTRWVL